MKLINKLSVLALASVALVGCADLDTEPLGSTVTDDQKAGVVDENPEMVKASVVGITTQFSVYMKTYENHNDFGYPAVMLFTDTRGIDMVSEDIGYNWFSGGLDFTDRAFNSSYTRMIWSTLYNQIFAANAVAKTMGITPENLAEKSDVSKFYGAQALAIRAFDYFNLAQLYQFTYIGNEDQPCVPLITDANADEVAANGSKRNSVKEIYEQILSDLNLADQCLQSNFVKREDKRYVNRAAVLGLRARVELVMNNWEAARNDAEEALKECAAEGITIADIADVNHPTFKDSNEKNWIWAIVIAETDRVVTSGIVNWPSHMGSLNYGYASVGAWRMISQSLYNSMSNSDVRKGWFLDGDCQSANLSAEQQAYVISAGCNPYTQVKFAPYKDEIYTSTNANDIPLMRIEELYLIKAEAEAMAGNPAQGVATLKEYMSHRDPEYSFEAKESGYTAAGVQGEVWYQRRIELWGEGLAWFDIMRLKKGVDRRGAGFEPSLVFNIPADDANLIFQIPKAEIEGNPALTDADNNPSATTPAPVPES